MRDVKHRALLLLPLWGACFLPDLSSKPCKDSSGCFTGYFCDTSRATADTIGYCTEGTLEEQGGSGVTPASLVMVAGGATTIGSTVDDSYGVKMAPTHSRTVGPFYLEDREVTVAAYRKCVESGACTRPHSADGLLGSEPCNYDSPGRDSYPVNCVDYGQASTYCGWLGRRLPTEAEWEVAAVGVTSSSGDKYPWGSTGDESKACFFKADPRTCAVALKVKTMSGAEVAASAPGFYDLAGNVLEWTASEPCAYQAGSSAPNPSCGMTDRVIRGGSAFDADIKSLRGTVRVAMKPDRNQPKSSWDRNLGLRCARTP